MTDLSEVGAITPQTQARMLGILHAAHQAGHDVPRVYGYLPTSTPEHNTGRALDFMVYADQAAGNWIADHIWANRAQYGLNWVIWSQRIRSTTPGHSGNWETMADRGTPTKNHMDHIHALFADQVLSIEQMIHGSNAA
jgi:hypothetical protein